LALATRARTSRPREALAGQARYAKMAAKANVEPD
jgi:hypothetical protein